MKVVAEHYHSSMRKWYEKRHVSGPVVSDEQWDSYYLGDPLTRARIGMYK